MFNNINANITTAAINNTCALMPIKVNNCVCEKEISLRIEIPKLVYDKLMCYFEKLNYKTLTKLNYTFPKGFRVIFANNYTLKQIKTQQTSQDYFLYYKNKYIFETIIKKSNEELISNTNEWENDVNLESSLQRHYVYHNKLRIGIEKKFYSKYTTNTANVFKPSMINLGIDKWVRLASKTFLHVECEYNGDSDLAISNFQCELEKSSLFDAIMQYIYTVTENVSLNELMENQFDVYSRNFTAILCEQPLFVAVKLDGIRKTCIIHQDTMIIDGAKNVKIKNQIAQPIKCHVEYINNVYYIIDILEIWGPKNAYIKPNHIQAIKIIQSKFIQQICTPYLTTNRYYSPGIEIPQTNIQNDGLLMFTKNHIVKYKEHTVDLILRKPIIKRDKKNKKDKLRNFYIANEDRENIPKSTTDEHCIEEMLLFADQTSFSSVFPSWTVDLNINQHNLFEDKNDSQKNSDYNFTKHSIVNFIILEFKLDYKNRKLCFIKKRSDKMQANTQNAMQKMLNL